MRKTEVAAVLISGPWKGDTQRHGGSVDLTHRRFISSPYRIQALGSSGPPSKSGEIYDILPVCVDGPAAEKLPYKTCQKKQTNKKNVSKQLSDNTLNPTSRKNAQP